MLAFGASAGAGRAPERLRVAVVALPAGEWAAAGLARAALTQLARVATVLPANAQAAQRLLMGLGRPEPVEKGRAPLSPGASTARLVEVGRLLRCRFVAVVEARGGEEASAELVDVASGARREVAARGPTHELSGLLALALADAMRLKLSPAEREELARPLAANRAAIEALWQGDAARDPQEQVRLYQAAAASDPASPVIRNQLGAALARVGQPDKALEQFDHAIRLDAAYAAAHTNRGLVLSQQKRWREAEAALRAAIGLGAKSPTPHIALARLLDRVGDIIEACDQLRQAVEIDPSHNDALMTLADFYFESYNLRAAREAAERVVELDPAHVGALNLIGLLLLVPHEYEEAEAVFLRALTAKPDDPETLANLALAIYGQGKADMAIGILKRTVELDPRCANAHHYLGRIYLAEKRPAEAAEAFQRAAELKPAVAAARRGLASARSEAAAERGGCGCMGLDFPGGPALSTSRVVGALLPFAALLAPHSIRLARRQRPRGSPARNGR